MDYFKESLALHQQNKGKIEIVSKVKLANKDDLSIAYTPGVAQPCLAISENKDDVYKYTAKGNLVAVVSDGSAVLGLGNIGAAAAIPVMEGKAILFKEFAGIDAFPLCLDTQDTDKIVETVQYLAPTFGGINLEDISAPRCFEVEERLQALLDIPVFHDDQHGTAVIIAAAMINGLRLTGKKIEQIKIVVNGTGAAGTAAVKMLISLGAANIIACDKIGILHQGLVGQISNAQLEIAKITNHNGTKGSLADALKGADVFIGVSAPNIVTAEMIQTMNSDAMVFAMANPIPEIMPDVARAAGARVVGTGRSDFPNQINNVLAFPGIFKGALAVRAKRITEQMKVAAVYAIAGVISDNELNEDYIIPNPFDKRVAAVVAKAVGEAWVANN